MKAFFTTVFFFSLVGLFAQTPGQLKQEFAIQLSESAIALKPGESKQVTLTILKSKSYAKGSVKLSTSSVLPEGLTLAFEPAEGNLETSVVTFTASADAKVGSYSLILNGLMNHKTKGSVVKVEVGDGSISRK